MRCIASAGLLAAALLQAPAAARAEVTECTVIATLPTTISVPGVYCLTADLATSQTSGAAITVAANSVTLDMNGWKLGGLGGGPTSTAVGILAHDRKNFTLRNGTIRGFHYGLHVTDAVASTGHLIEDMTFDANIYTGASVAGSSFRVVRNAILNTVTTSDHAIGLDVSGEDVVVAENLISNVSGIQANGNAPVGLRGIFLQRATIANNTIIGVTSNSPAAGMSVSASANVVVEANKVIGLGHVAMYGITIVNSNLAILRGNIVTSHDVTPDGGIFVQNNATNVACIDNLVDGFVTPIFGCATTSGDLTP